RRVDDVEHTLVRADLELLARLLVDVRRAVHGELLDPRRQRDRSPDARARALRRVDDLARRLVEHAVVVRPEADPDVLAFHDAVPALPAFSQPLLYDLGDDAGADGAAALADGEAQALVHGDGRDQLHLHGDVVPRHHHLGAR